MVNTDRLSLESAEKLFSALADPIALRLLMLLAAQDLCVCELSRLIGIPQPTLSNHLRVLRERGLVVREAKGRWRLYSLGNIPGPIRKLLADLLDDDAVKSDMKKLVEYLKGGRLFCEGEAE